MSISQKREDAKRSFLSMMTILKILKDEWVLNTDSAMAAFSKEDTEKNSSTSHVKAVHIFKLIQ